MRDNRMYQYVNFQQATYPDGNVYPQAKIVMKPSEVDDIQREIAYLKEKNPDKQVMLSITWDENRIRPTSWGGKSARARMTAFLADPDYDPKAKKVASQPITG